MKKNKKLEGEVLHIIENMFSAEEDNKHLKEFVTKNKLQYPVEASKAYTDYIINGGKPFLEEFPLCEVFMDVNNDCNYCPLFRKVESWSKLDKIGCYNLTEGWHDYFNWELIKDYLNYCKEFELFEKKCKLCGRKFMGTKLRKFCSAYCRSRGQYKLREKYVEKKKKEVKECEAIFPAEKRTKLLMEEFNLICDTFIAEKDKKQKRDD